MKHEGLWVFRLQTVQNNPREVAFAAEWKEENDEEGQRRHILQSLIPDATERDAMVAATIIQWLGSNVGMGFLHEVMRREPKVREHLRL